MAYTPKGLFFDEFEIGASYTTTARTVTEADIVSFAGVSGDFNPLHTDETFAANTPFGTRIAHGMLKSGAVRDPDNPGHIDPTITRVTWADYPILFPK